MKLNEPKAGPDLYILVRQGFVGQNSSLNRWCKENGINRRNAEAALKGMWNGPKGRKLRNQLISAAGLASTLSCEQSNQKNVA